MSDGREMTVIPEQELAEQYSGLGMARQSVTSSQAIQAMTAVLDKQVATAKAFPRSAAEAFRKCVNLLKVDKQTAMSAEYRKPIGKDRNGKEAFVTGPSVRLTELISVCWGNLQIKIDEPVISDKSVMVRATAWDLEANLSQEAVVTAPILYKNGGRYAQHMIDNTVMACQSKARRNAVIAIIPRAYINSLLDEAATVAKANQPPISERRAKALEFFEKNHKVKPKQVFSYLEVAGIEDITEEHLDDLRGVMNAIKDGEIEVDAIFPAQEQSRMQTVSKKLEEAKAGTSTKPQETPPADPGQLFGAQGTDEKKKLDATK